MLENIKKSCSYVAANSKYVKINYDVLDNYIKNMDATKVKFWLSSNPYHILDMDIEKIINFLLLFESTDYCFWGNPKWVVETNEGKKDGSDALLYSLLNYINNNDLANISFEEFSNILKGNVEIPFLKERYETISSISKAVNERMNGNFYNFIKDINKKKKVTIILTTHDMRDIESLANRLIIIGKGKKLYDGDIKDIKEKYIKNKIVEIFFSDLQKIPDIKNTKIISKEKDVVRILIDTKKVSVSSITLEYSKVCEIKDVNIIEKGIDDIIYDLYQELGLWVFI